MPRATHESEIDAMEDELGKSQICEELVIITGGNADDRWKSLKVKNESCNTAKMDEGEFQKGEHRL